MITLYRWNRETRKCEWLPGDLLKSEPETLKASHCVLWVDLDNPSAEEEQLVCARCFPIHPLTLEDMTRLRRAPTSPPHFPKAEEFPDYLFVITNPLSERFLASIRKGRTADAGLSMTTQLSAILTINLLITHHYEPTDAVEELRRYLARHDSQGERGPDYLFHLILDTSVDQYAAALDHVDDSLDGIEKRVFLRPNQQQLLSSLLRVKREIISLRKTLVYEREVLARLARGEFELIDEREMVYYRNVYDHLVRFTELAESSREMVTDLMQTSLAAASNRLNEVMKVLTMISTLVLPMTLIAGIYGMNFEILPEKNWTYGYPFALGLMLVTGLSSFLFFKWKKWI